jgi:hypothetical protein
LYDYNSREIKAVRRAGQQSWIRRIRGAYQVFVENPLKQLHGRLRKDVGR